MKSGDRLNQIEPLVAEMLIKLDQTAAKVDRVSEDVAELRVSMKRNSEKLDKHTDILFKQSHAISFLLENQVLTNNKIDKMDVRIDNLETRMDRVEDRLDKIEVKIDKIDNRLDKIEITTDAILTLLKNKN